MKFLSDTKNEAQLDKTRTETEKQEKQQPVNKQQQPQTEKKQFAQVSQDMSELVYHLNSIQNDISELAGRPISLTKIDD